MPDGDGFDLLRKVKEFNFNIIFTTAFSEFAVKAFKYNTVDYLLKPIIQDDLVNAVQKAQEELKRRDLTEKFSNLLDYINNGKNTRRIVLSSNERYDVVNISEIIMCKSDRNYTSFYLDDGQVIKVAKTMKEFSDQLEENDFIKPHRGYLVNPDHIRSFSRAGTSAIRLTRNLEAPVSSRNKDKLLEIIHRL
jgi:two-component system LytT family response regulator